MNAIRHIVSSFIVAIVMCVFAGSAMAFDLGGALKQLQQVVEQQPEQKTEQKQPEKQNTSVQPNQQQNTSANPSANQSTQGQSAQESPSAPKQNTASVGISTEGFCDKVQSTGVYIKFAKLVGDEVRSKTDVKYLTGRGLFDSKDYLLQKWLEDRRRNTFKERTDKKYDRVYKSEFKQCVAKLLPTDFAYVFYTPENVERLRNLSASTETERKVNEKGEVVVKEIDRRHLPEITNVFPSWEAFIFGGENLLSTTGEEYLKDLEVSLKENKEAVIAKNAAKETERKSAEKTAVETAANNKKVAQENAIKIAQIKKGDYSQVKSCSEISEALKSPFYAFQVLVTPPKTMYGGIGWLAEHSDSVLGGSEEMLRSNDRNRVYSYIKLKIPKNALLLNTKNAHIDGAIQFVGNYSANSSVSLTSGASVAVPVFDASCVEY